jgi:hypothetical protein
MADFTAIVHVNPLRPIDIYPEQACPLVPLQELHPYQFVVQGFDHLPDQIGQAFRRRMHRNSPQTKNGPEAHFQIFEQSATTVASNYTAERLLGPRPKSVHANKKTPDPGLFYW